MTEVMLTSHERKIAKTCKKLVNAGMCWKKLERMIGKSKAEILHLISLYDVRLDEQKKKEV